MKKSSRCAILSYDYTVLAGTQGALNHRKTDRMLEVAENWRMPVVFFTEGGGGRAGAGSSSTPTLERWQKDPGGGVAVQPDWTSLRGIPCPSSVDWFPPSVLIQVTVLQETRSCWAAVM